MSSEIFISEFHNIEGVLIGERKQNVHKLLRNKNITGDEDKLILDDLKPRTYLETLMYVDILIYLRKTVQLVELLKNGNEACVSKIVKQPWFFKEAFNNIGAEELVDELLPSMSLSVKMKVLKKLSLVFPEEKMDKVFDAVLKRYGLFIATSVIPACSPQKIEHILKNHEVKFWPNQLKIIYKKQPDLIKIYLDVEKQRKRERIFENNFLIYLAQNNPTLFWYIMENHEIDDDLKLGRRTTKGIIETKIREIVNEPKKYIKHFRHETLVRNLNKLGEFKQFYHNLFPRDIEKLDHENVLCKRLLKYYPKNSRYQIYTETFSDVLNENILSNLSYLDEFFFKFIADMELRETLAEVKCKESNDNEYIKYYKPERCFALITEKIHLTASRGERRRLLCILVKSCAVNKDMKYLEEVLRYFCGRHRNADVNTKTDFLDAIESNFTLEDLNETHWKYVNEILTIQSLHNKVSGHMVNLKVSGHTKLKIIYIKYLCKNNRPEDDINYGILEYLKTVIYNLDFHSFSDIKDHEIEKKILMQAMEYFPTLIKTQKKENQKNDLFPLVITEIFLYNLRHPKNVMTISEELLQTLRNILEDQYSTPYYLYEAFSKIVCKLNRNNLENYLLTRYWKKIVSQCNVDKVIRWYLKYDPMVIVENFDQIVKIAPYHTTTIWPKVKSYSHLNLDNIVVEQCVKHLNNGEDDDKFESVRRLSILAAPEYFMKIMESGNFIPTSPKLIIKDQTDNNIYKVQRAFLTNLTNLKDPLKYLPILVETFCQGDYLQPSLAPLYSAFYKRPESELKPYLNTLSKNPAISVKKHALNLACCVFEQKVIFDILNDFAESEKNSSLQKSIFLSCLRYFSKNPSEELFEKVIFYMSFLKEQDKESLNIIHTVNIPINYRPSYIQHILKLIEKFKDNDKEGKAAEFNKVISSILDLIDEHCIQKLPQVFCREIIQKYFLINEDIPGIFPFVIKVLIHRNETDNFDFVFRLLSSYKLQHWQNSSMIKERENIYTFFRIFHKEASGKEVTLNFVEQFSNNWEKIFSPIETFEEYVLLNLLRFKKDSKNEPEKYSKEIVLFSEKLVEEFGQIVFSKFVIVLAKFFNYEREERINLLSNMLKFKTTTLNCILVIELIALQHDLFYKDKMRPMYRDIDSVLKEITDPKVQIFYNLCLKK